MLNLKINYLLHTLLHSRYKLIINLFITIVIYTVIYSTNYAFCMNNTNNIIDISPNLDTNSQAEDLRREISAFADSQATLLEKIDTKNKSIQELIQTSNRQRLEILELRRQNGALGRTIHDLRETITDLEKEADDYYNMYKGQCKLNGHLGRRINEYKQSSR